MKPFHRRWAKRKYTKCTKKVKKMYNVHSLKGEKRKWKQQDERKWKQQDGKRKEKAKEKKKRKKEAFINLAISI